MIVLSFMYPPSLFLLVPRAKNCCKFWYHTREYIYTIFFTKIFECKSRNFQMKAANGCLTDSILQSLKFP